MLFSRAVQFKQTMPTVLRSGPYRFYFYSHEPNEPVHVHRDELSAKYWLDRSAWHGKLGLVPVR